MKKILPFFLFIFVVFSCESNCEPKVYDKTYKKIENALKLTHYLIDIRNFEEAEKQINKNLDLYPDNFDLTLMRGWLFLQKNDLENSKKILSDLHSKQESQLDNKKYNPMLCIGLSRIARLEENYQLAQEELDHVRKSGSLLSVYWTEQGFIQFDQKKYELAEKSFGKAVILDKNNIDATFYKYVCLLYLGREIDEIKQSWLAITKMENVSTIYYLIHAQTLYELKMRDLCKHVLQEGLDRFPNNMFLNNFYAYFLYEDYLQNKDSTILDEALKYIEKCFKNPERVQPEFVDTYLHILEECEKPLLIKEILETYYLKFPNSNEIIFWLRKYEI